MEEPNLPRFEIDESRQQPSRKLTYREFMKLFGETVVRLKESGRYEQLRNDPTRQPSKERFHII